MHRVLLFLIATLLALPVQAGDKRPPEELKARAEAATGDAAAELYAELVRRLIEVANDQFAQGEPGKGHQSVKEAVAAAEKARAAALGSTSRKVKKTEIALRKAARRLDEIRRTLALDDRPPLEEAVNRIEQLRLQILNQMFAPRPKDNRQEKKP